MSTPVRKIYDIFLKQIGKDVMLLMRDDLIEDLLYTYLQGSIVEFEECEKDLSIVEDFDEDELVIVDDLTNEEEFILSRGMILYWLQPKILTQEVIKMKITDGDYSMKSSANLLNNLIKLKESSEKDMRRRKIKYSHRGRSFNE